jgi:hypothetical protein
LRLVARNGDTLADATSFQLEGTGFGDETAAREAGEKLRLRLRLLNAMLGLGINVPTTDLASTSISEHVKAKLQSEHQAVIMDGIRDLAVFPTMVPILSLFRAAT